MKKIWMILLAMLLATGLVVMGCGGGSDNPPPAGGNPEIVYQLSTDFLADLSLGTFANDDVFKGADSWLLAAGGVPNDVSFEVIDIGDGEKALKVTAIATWGAGLDIKSSNLQEGDFIGAYIVVDTAMTLGFDSNAGGAARMMGDTSDGTAGYELEYIYQLTAADKAAIDAANSGAGCIRIKSNPNATGTFTIYEIVIGRGFDNQAEFIDYLENGPSTGGGEDNTPVVEIYGQADAGTVVLAGTTITVDWLSTSGSWGFSVETPAGTTASSTVVISTTYTAGTEGTPAFIIKQGTGWTDLSTAKYPNFKDYSGVVEVDMSLFNTDSLGKIFFQFNTGDNPDGADFELTIDSVTLQ